MTHKTTALFAKLRLQVSKIRADQKGVALVISLLVMLVLVLLALSLVLQSQTEYVGSVNETDSMEALSHAEAGLDWFGRKVKDYLGQSPTPADFDDMLDGPSTGDCSTPGTCDNLVGFRTISSTLSLTDLNNTCPGANCETTTSVIVPFDWDNDGTEENFEAFRVGVDTDGDGNWDGPRAILYVRIDDNYDEGSGPPAVYNNDDLDYRIRVRVRSDYPIFVDSDGAAQDPILAQRGIGIRRLEGSVAPSGGIAIRTDGDFRGAGGVTVCGDCGGVHANEDMNWEGSDADLCYRATASGTFDDQHIPNVPDYGGGRDEEFIPVINPYDDLYAPDGPAAFDHSTDGELDDDPTLGTVLQCPQAQANDPGASKYFAVVLKREANQQKIQIYKAYWDFGAISGNANKWLWRKIDETDPSTGDTTLDAVLDNCGRLVSSTINSVTIGPDPNANTPVPDDVDVAGTGQCWPGCLPDHCTPDGVIDSCDGDNGDDDFYGITAAGNYQTATCTNVDGDETLTGTADNDFTRQNFWIVTGLDSTTGSVTSFTTNSDTAVPPLPGTFSPDSQPDFDWDTATQHNKTFHLDADVVFAPLYNAVIWTSGNIKIAGDTSSLQYYDPDPVAGVKTTSVPNGYWRVSIIAYGTIQTNGGRLAAAVGSTNTSYRQVGLVAGRDLEMYGDSGMVEPCDSDPVTTGVQIDCDLDAPMGTPPDDFQSFFLAHEQLRTSGSPAIVGFVIAEDADFCVQDPSTGESNYSFMNGSPSVYYDCENPPDPWFAETTKIQSWEEIQ